MRRFEEEYGPEYRRKEALRVKGLYPDRVPVIVEAKSERTPQIDRRKFIVPRDMLVSQLLIVVRKRINIAQAQAVFLFVDQRLLSGSESLSAIASRSSRADGFLYIVYDIENTFG